MTAHIRILGPAKDLNAVRTGKDGMLKWPLASDAKALRIAYVKEGEHLMLAFDSPTALQEWLLAATLQTWCKRVPELRRKVENEFGPVREHSLTESERIDHELGKKRMLGLRMDLGIAQCDRDEARAALLEIFKLLNGVEWTSETCDEIARVLRGQQMIVKDVSEHAGPMGQCSSCGSTSWLDTDGEVACESCGAIWRHL